MNSSDSPTPNLSHTNQQAQVRRLWIQRLSLWGLAASAAGMGASFSCQQLTDHNTPNKPKDTNSPITELWNTPVTDTNGRLWHLGELQNQPLLLNFWATWCPPCVKELPELERFFHIWATKGWQVLALAIDSAQSVNTFIKRHQLKIPVALSQTQGLQLSRVLGNEKGELPFTVLISSSGKIIQSKKGPTDFDEINDWALSIHKTT